MLLNEQSAEGEELSSALLDRPQRALEESEERYRRLVELSPDAVFVIQDGIHVFTNTRGLDLLAARSLEELQTRKAIEFMHPSFRALGLQRTRAITENGESLGYVEEKIVRLDGVERDIESAGSPIVFRGRAAALVVVRDITGRKTSEQALRQAEQRFHSTFAHAPIGMALLDRRGRILEANPSLSHILGQEPAELKGQPFENTILLDDRIGILAGFERLLDGDTLVHHSEVRCLRSDAGSVWGMVSISAISGSSEGASFVLQLQDVTHRREAEALLTHQALHDPLTKLPNRVLLLDRLSRALRRSNSIHRVAVFFLDIDRFKTVNDSLGHSVGDQMLVEVAARLVAIIRPGDTVARFGGDEFTVVCSQIPSGETAEAVADRLRQVFEAPFVIPNGEFHLSVSIGVAMGSPEDEAAAVLRDADAAMSEAKDRGRNRAELFDEDLRARVLSKMDTEVALRRALERNELTLYYQPVVNLETGKIRAMEALVRWARPGIGLVSPADFIPLAEETGLIVPLGYYVLSSACEQLGRWVRDGVSDSSLVVGVNLSAQQFADPSLARLVSDQLTMHGLSPSQLCLEITESYLMDNLEQMKKVVLDLQDLGVKVVIDDFGTGYSSLAQLRRLPVGWLKIDQMFAADLHTENGVEIYKSVLQLAHALKMSVIAEGVEDASQLAVLRKLGCDHAQGYHLARPQPPELFAALLQQSPQW